jgi:hypothetical protein
MNHKSFVPCFLILILTLSSVGGAVSHFCLDGIEPTVSYHFDNIGGHQERDLELAHQYVEKNVLADNLSFKVIDIDIVFVLVALINMLVPAAKSVRFSYSPENQPKHLLFVVPPLRAPPLNAFS